MDMNNLAILYDTQKRYAVAENLYKQAQEIWEATLGPNHPYVAANLESYATLLRMTNRGTEADKLLTRAKGIRSKISSPEGSKR